MRVFVYALPVVLSLFLAACGGEESIVGECSIDADCGDTTIYFCDKVNHECRQKAGTDADVPMMGDDGNTGIVDDDQGGNGEGVLPDGEVDPQQDIDYAGLDCAPGTTEKCTYTGPAGTEDVGACKAPVRLCKSDGTWGNCNGEVRPIYEVCNDGVDQDCNGTVDDGTDLDGDGFTYCDTPPDCCEDTDKCPDPFSVHPGADEVPNGIDDNCDGNIDEGVYDCDTGLNLGTKDPFDYARAIGLCNGVVQADIILPNGQPGCNINSNSLLGGLGAVIVPKQGGSMLALSSGQAMNPPSNTSYNQGTSSAAPGDWYGANGNKYPSSPSCGGGTGTSGNANDGVMVQFKVQVPPSANSFSFNIYFLSIEYPSYICSQFNDFFVALLDSGYNTSPGADPTLLNPADKNLAIDDMKNPVGVNIAPNGLFKQCTNVSGSGWAVTSCVGTNELQGTGFEGHGATSWLVTRGNVVPGEIITLRFAIWDLGDHILDSMVLIDNFQWQSQNFKPGTGES